MPRGWEGNLRSGVVLAMRHELVVYPPTGSMATEREMSTPPTPRRGMARFTFTLPSGNYRSGRPKNSKMFSTTGPRENVSRARCDSRHPCTLRLHNRSNWLFYCILHATCQTCCLHIHMNPIAICLTLSLSAAQKMLNCSYQNWHSLHNKLKVWIKMISVAQYCTWLDFLTGWRDNLSYLTITT